MLDWCCFFFSKTPILFFVSKDSCKYKNLLSRHMKLITTPPMPDQESFAGSVLQLHPGLTQYNMRPKAII